MRDAEPRPKNDSACPPAGWGRLLTWALLALAVLLPRARAEEKPFRIVGPAAGADCRTVQEAIEAIPADNAAPKLILLQPGAFFGHTVLDKPFVTLRGAGPPPCTSRPPRTMP